MSDEDWSDGLCGQVCGGDCNTCLGAWFCTPCLFGRADSRLKKFPSVNKDELSSCNGGCGIFCAASCCHLGWLVTLLKRGELRDRFGIRGDACTDCLASYFCTPCTLAQMDTELKARAARVQGGMSGVPGDGMVKQGEYAPPQDQMTYGHTQPQ